MTNVLHEHKKDCKFAKTEMRFTYQILTNLSCNLDCSYCYERKNTWVNNIEDIKIFLNGMFERDKGTDHGRIIEFIGGESLLYPDLLQEIINYAQFLTKKYKTCSYYSTCTNGTLFKVKNVRDFLENNKSLSIGISIDGTKELHDKNRYYAINSKGTYDDIMEWWPWFKDHLHSTNRIVSIKSTFTKEDFKNYYVESMKNLYSLEPDQFSSNIIFEDVLTKEDAIWIYDRLIQVLDYALDNNLHKKIQLLKFFPQNYDPTTMWFNKSIPENNYCGSGKWMTTLGVGGKIFGCNRFTTNGKEGLHIGEIIDGKVVMQNPCQLFEDIKNQYLYWPQECMNCHLKRACASCVAAPYDGNSVQETLAKKSQCGWTFAFGMAKLYLTNRLKEIGE